MGSELLKRQVLTLPSAVSVTARVQCWYLAGKEMGTRSITGKAWSLKGRQRVRARLWGKTSRY